MDFINIEKYQQGIDESTDLSLNQFLNFFLFYIIKQYKLTNLESDLDLNFLLEILKDLYNNKEILIKILNNEDLL